FVFLFSQKYPQTSAHIFCYLGRYILRIYLLLHSFVFSCRPTYVLLRMQKMVNFNLPLLQPEVSYIKVDFGNFSMFPGWL
ncbi:hypothetical protein LC612_12850, partial [Nostoc sp. CHAB 5834]|nr:hypothetical protein [Nostoc sp. CHAB 5834]